MKSILLFTIFISSKVISQNIQNKANLIVVRNVSFEKVCTILADSGYVILSKDVSLQQVTTEMKHYKNANAAFRIVARVKDSTLYLKAFFTAPWALSDAPLFKDDRAFVPVRNKKPRWETFAGYPMKEMSIIANALSRDVEYRIE